MPSCQVVLLMALSVLLGIPLSMSVRVEWCPFTLTVIDLLCMKSLMKLNMLA